MAPLSSSSLSPSSCSVADTAIEGAEISSQSTRAWQQMKQLFFRMFQPNHEETSDEEEATSEEEDFVTSEEDETDAKDIEDVVTSEAEEDMEDIVTSDEEDIVTSEAGNIVTSEEEDMLTRKQEEDIVTSEEEENQDIFTTDDNIVNTEEEHEGDTVTSEAEDIEDVVTIEAENIVNIEEEEDIVTCEQDEEDMVQTKSSEDNEEKDLVQTKSSKAMDLFVLFNHLPAHPVSYSLYRIKVSYPSSPPHLPDDFDVTSSSAFSSPDVIKPILEIPSTEEKFPENMCCVQVNSKIYFLGGIVNGISPPDVYVLDISDIDGDCSRNNHQWLKKNVAGRLINGKAKPYAFVVKNKIFVINNHKTSHEHDFSFEVFSPLKKRRKSKPSRKLPDPPIDLIVHGHAVVGDKLFLTGPAYRGDCNVVVCLNLNNGYKWVKKFVQGFLPDHEFYGEGHLLGDTLYALSGFNGAIPAAYNLNPERVRRNLSECFEMNKEFMDLDSYASELFEDLALLTPNLEAVHEHVFYDWLESSLLHVGDGIFCYLSTGEFPHDSSPEYSGVNLTFFKPSKGTFTEIICDIETKSFNGGFLSFAHLKYNYSSSRNIGAFQGCFSVPRDGAGHPSMKLMHR